MKWTIPKAPQEGDIRKRRPFAWFPVHTKFEDTTYKVWLETYQVTECYVKSASMDDFYQHGHYYWMEIRKEPLFGEYESV